jgi:hypothetical protein
MSLRSDLEQKESSCGRLVKVDKQDPGPDFPNGGNCGGGAAIGGVTKVERPLSP